MTNVHKKAKAIFHYWDATHALRAHCGSCGDDPEKIIQIAHAEIRAGILDEFDDAIMGPRGNVVMAVSRAEAFLSLLAKIIEPNDVSRKIQILFDDIRLTWLSGGIHDYTDILSQAKEYIRADADLTSTYKAKYIFMSAVQRYLNPKGASAEVGLDRACRTADDETLDTATRAEGMLLAMQFGCQQKNHVSFEIARQYKKKLLALEASGYFGPASVLAQKLESKLSDR